MKIFKLLIAFVLFSLSLNVAHSKGFEEGVHYDVISESNDAKEEGVVEFFSFYCVHCYRFEPIAESLQSEFGDLFSKVHVPSVGPGYEAGVEMTKAFILSKKLGVSTEISDAIFTYNFEDKNILRNRKDIRNVFILNGITGDQYDDGISSFSIKATMNHWERMIDKYNVRATPTFIVNGKYKINPTSLRDSDDFTKDMLNLTKYLLNK